jgi:inosine-uridine nucleoside N-ribohydrolase
MAENETGPESADHIRDTLRLHAETYGPPEVAQKLAAIPDFPPRPDSMPLIVDTDIGGEPGATIALALAATAPQLKLVITSDEHEGRRARLARHLLDLLGRPDVAVVAGKDLGNTDNWSTAGLIPEHVPPQPDRVVPAVSAVLDRADGPVRWVGAGPLSNLAEVLATIPNVAARLDITQLAGESSHQHESYAKHTIRRDADAAQAFLATAIRPRLVPSAVACHPENETSAESHHLMTAAEGDAGMLIEAHAGQWFAHHSGYMQQDAIVLALGMGLPFIHSALIRIDVDAAGKLGPGEHQVFLTHSVGYPAFGSWLARKLGGVTAVQA